MINKTDRTYKLYRIVIVLAVVGIGLALYLFYLYLAPAQPTPCYINATINCEATTKGTLANTLGIPTPLWGLTGYTLILISALKRWKRFLFGMAAFGLLFCLRITYLEIFVIRVICPVCILCQLVMLGEFVLGYQILQKRYVR